MFSPCFLSPLSHPFIPKPTIFAKPAVGLVVSDSLFTDEAAENYIITFQWRILDKHFFFFKVSFERRSLNGLKKI